eukprot:TRINITY_DN1494_c0_g2_i1.p1 TRINITY_DN1494_c0_g2~~TRINITY_DN1494_c0_g2_i1.p1  ORF type:complete len:191 (+),score=41.65 TRINITY_DN1494_c0_g2_i1:254-826(+)
MSPVVSAAAGLAPGETGLAYDRCSDSEGAPEYESGLEESDLDELDLDESDLDESDTDNSEYDDDEFPPGQDPHEAALAIFGAPLHSLEALRIIGDDMVKYDNPFAEGRHAEWFAAILGCGLKGDMLFANGMKLALQPWLDHLHTAGKVTPDTLKQWLADASAIHHECCYGEATGELLEEYARQCFESISP